MKALMADLYSKQTIYSTSSETGSHIETVMTIASDPSFLSVGISQEDVY
jgi:hypothetical protein